MAEIDPGVWSIGFILETETCDPSAVRAFSDSIAIKEVYMMKQTTEVRSKPNVVLRPLATGNVSIEEAAETVSLAFAVDPLLKFLYKNQNGQTWGNLLPKTQIWQQHRLRSYQLDGEIIEAIVDGKNAGLCILHPPRRWNRLFKWQWVTAYVKALVLRLVDPANEECCDPERVAQLFVSAKAQNQMIESKYPPKTLYYIPMIVVHPSSQGMGIGGQLMKRLLDRIGDAPSYLECTNAENVPFYEKYGFQVMDEACLVDRRQEGQQVTLYHMVRDTGRKL